jgi:hypothetical protein
MKNNATIRSIASAGLRPCYLALLLAWSAPGLTAGPPKRQVRLECIAPRKGQLEDVIRVSRIQCQGKKGISVSVAVSDVTEVAYDFANLNMSAGISEEVPDYAQVPFVGQAVWVGEVIVRSFISAASRRRHHYVSVFWSNASEVGTLIFRLRNKQEAALVYNRLALVTGNEVVNRVQRR